MDYVKGIFKNRPNRFIAEVEVDGKIDSIYRFRRGIAGV